VLSDERAGDLVWSLADHQGSVRDIIDASGNPINQITYSAFGEVVAETNPSVRFLFGYTGAVFDIETGLGYHRARYLDHATGRWISEDPIGFAGGQSNLYVYVRNHPTSLVDPLGLWSISIPGPDLNTPGGLATALIDRFIGNLFYGQFPFPPSTNGDVWYLDSQAFDHMEKFQQQAVGLEKKGIRHTVQQYVQQQLAAGNCEGSTTLRRITKDIAQDVALFGDTSSWGARKLGFVLNGPESLSAVHDINVLWGCGTVSYYVKSKYIWLDTIDWISIEAAHESGDQISTWPGWIWSYIEGALGALTNQAGYGVFIRYFHSFSDSYELTP
jgi:RHS repeat-associated protein